MFYLIKFLLILNLFINIYGKPNYEKKFGGYVYEGDMILTEQEVDNIEKTGEFRPKQVSMGGAVAGFSTTKKAYRWPNGVVPYVNDIKCPIQFLFGKSLCWIHGATKEIAAAMKHWEKHTCVKFKKRDNERDYIRFINGGKGKCYSHVGRIGGQQVVSLGHQCRKTGIAIHEIGHALGLLHEQSRPDRDQYVKILWGNIKESYKPNFRKFKYSDLDDQGYPYDYESIMHYKEDSFVKRYGMKSIIPLQKGVKIGQRNRLSKGDIEEMNSFYDCKRK